jgi:hypothetical protein
MAQFNSDYYASQEPPLITACNGRTAPYNYVAGQSSGTSFKIQLVSDPVDNIVKASFLEEAGSDTGYHRDFLQAYDPTISKLSDVGFVDNYTTQPKYLIKQLNHLGQVTAQGHCVRWVAGDLSNKSEAYIKVTSGTFVSSGVDAGVLYQQDTSTGFQTAWGSSVARIYLLTDVYRFDVIPENALTSDQATSIIPFPYDYGDIPGTGILTEINIRRYSGSGSGVVVATGYIFALKTQATDPPGTFPYVHITSMEGQDGTVPYTTTSGGERATETASYSVPTVSYYIEAVKLDGFSNPCFRYRIGASYRFDVGTYAETFKRVEFVENGSAYPEIDVTLTNPNVFQYTWDSFNGGTNTANTIEAIPYAFVPDESALYIDECDPAAPFLREYGPIYQDTGAEYVVWGNRAFTTDTQFAETKRGRFVNIKHSLDNNYSNQDYNANWTSGGETLIQTLSRTIAYDSTYNYTPNSKIFQIRSSADYDYSSATVVSWEYPDNTKSSGQPMILVARIDKTGPAQPGNYIDVNDFQDLQPFRVGGLPDIPVGDFVYGGKIVPQDRLSMTDDVADDWPYEVTGANVFFSDRKYKTATTYTKQDESPLSITVGTTRIRSISLGPTPINTEADVLYKYYLFDIKMTEQNSVFGDITNIVYDDETNPAKTLINISENSGRRDIEEVFSGTNQTITTKKTAIFDPTKDRLIYEIPYGQIFENVLTSQPLTIELQKIFSHDFVNPAELTWNVGEEAGTNDKFLVADPDVNWFAVNADTGITFSLVESTTPDYSQNQLGYSIAVGGALTIYAPQELALEQAKVNLFAKTERTFSSSNIRKKTLTTATENIVGLQVSVNDGASGEYCVELMSPFPNTNWSSLNLNPGNIESIGAIYATDSSGNIIKGGQNLVSYFVLSSGSSDQVVARPKLILGSAHINSAGEIDPVIFGTRNPGEVRLMITYDYYQFDDLSSNISTRESFVDDSGIVSNSYVPFYFSKNSGSAIHESAIIDFRPNSLLSADTFYLDGKITPHIDWADEIAASYYLPRRDKLILTRDGKFEILYGKPSLSPKYPSDVPNSMSLYLLEKDPFVFGPYSIRSKMIDNRRYTMRDIGKIEKRVQKLEYYTTLSVMEKKAEDMLVLDANGNDRFKNGILVDTFEGHKIGDISNRDYNISVDFTNRYARPPFRTYSNNFVINSTGSSTFQGIASTKNETYSDLYMFPYSNSVFVAQPLATRAITVQPHDTIQYEGVLEITPSIDTWVSTTRRPDVNVNLAGENDAWDQMVSSFNNNNLAPFGTQWGEWETLSRVGSKTLVDSETETVIREGWHFIRGRRRGPEERTIENITTNTFLVNQELEQIRNSITRTLSTSTTDVSLGDRVVDVRLIPYMRHKNVKIIARGMKPNTRVYVYFDGVNVEEYCYNYASAGPLFGVTNPQALLNYPGTELPEGNGGVHFATATSDQLKTNSNGNIFIEFRIPDGMFRVGDRKFEITSDSRNNPERASTYASGIYSASGLRTEMEETIATTRNFQISDQLSGSETRSVDMSGIFTETTSTTVVETRRRDPLAQTFFVDPEEHPEGIFLSSVDLFFARKPENSTMLPVQVQIRPVVNGYPDSTRIYPNGKVVKLPSDVQVSEDASVKTTFEFNNPVHLPPGEHSLVVKGDTSEYEIYVATLGDFILGTDTKVTNQPYVGVFFTSANASTWTADQNTDMMMVLNKCEFTVNTTYNLVLRTEQTESDNPFELMNINSKYVDFNSCRTSWFVGITTAVGSTNSSFYIEPNTNFELSNTYSYGTRKGSPNTDVPVNLTISALTTNKDVCPIIDLQSLGLFAVNNLVEGNDASTNGELSPYVPVTTGTPRARYISRVVTLEDGFDSNNMKVVLSLNKPAGTNIQVFAKTQDTESTDDFHSNSYVALTPNVANFEAFTTTNPDEFREIEFSMSQDTDTPYNRFCVKVCLYSDQPWNVPKIRDLRAVAVL